MRYALLTFLIFGSGVEAAKFDFGMTGSFKDIATGARFSDDSLTGMERMYDNKVLLRLYGDMRAGDYFVLDYAYEIRHLWGDTLKAEAAPGEGIFSYDEFISPAADNFLDLEDDLSEGGNYRLQHLMDRLALRYRHEYFDLTAGRTALSWGSGYTWNPTDLINPFRPSAIDTEWKPGTDMVLFEAPFGFAGEAAGAWRPGRNEENEYDEDESSLLFRVKNNIWATDMAVMGGVNYTDITAGVSIAGQIEGAGYWIEGTYTDPEEKSDFIRITTGVNYRWENGLFLYGEYYFNDLGVNDDGEYVAFLIEEADRLTRGEIYNIGRHYLSVMGEYELTPLWILSGGVVCNLLDGSLFLGPSLSWSVRQNTSLLMGVNLFLGGNDTEYGGVEYAGITFEQPDVIYLKLAQYFSVF